jgi:regulator of protease activity HflC (stomatin/prohibitin superfamily)
MDFSTIVFLFFSALVIITLKFAIKIVPQSENWVVERLGRYNRTLNAGLQIITPFIETIRYKVSVQETQLPPDPIKAITLDNVSIAIRLAILYRIVDPSKSKYRIENLERGIKTVIEGTVRNLIGKTELDGVQSNRRHIVDEIENELQHIAEEWGIKLTRVEVTEVDVDESTREAMQIQLNAERSRRGLVTSAEGEKQAAQLKADADLYTAQKHAEAKRILADAEAYSVSVIAAAIEKGGTTAIDFEIKKLQTSAIRDISESDNSKIILLPSDVLSALSTAVSKTIEKVR